ARFSAPRGLFWFASRPPRRNDRRDRFWMPLADPVHSRIGGRFLPVTDSVERSLDKIGTTDYIFWSIETFTPGPGEKESGRALKAVCAVLAEEARRKKKL